MKYILGGPWYRSQIDARCATSLVTLALVGEMCNARLLALMFEDGLLDMSRGRLMQRALDSGADWLISLDADSALPSTDAMEHARRVFQALAETRDEAVAIVGFPMRQGHGGYNVIEVGGKRCDLRPSKRRETAAIGTGAIAFRLAWYREHWPSDMPFFQTVMRRDGAKLWAIGEDYGHCGRVGSLGGKVICDGRVRFIHHTARPGTPEAAASERDQ
jgi:hypothetical protein